MKLNKWIYLKMKLYENMPNVVDIVLKIQNFQTNLILLAFLADIT